MATKATKRKPAKRGAPHKCTRCNGTGSYKQFGRCFACGGTGVTTKQQRPGASKWRGGGNTSNLCQHRSETREGATLYCYKNAQHAGGHMFAPKRSERPSSWCQQPVTISGNTYLCTETAGHNDDCKSTLYSLYSSRGSVAAAAGPKPRCGLPVTHGSTTKMYSCTKADDHMGRCYCDDDTRAELDAALVREPGATPEVGWTDSQREGLDALVGLFKD